MSKALGFVISVFLILVVGNTFLNGVGSFFRVNSYARDFSPSGLAIINNAAAYSSSDGTTLSMSLFTKDGSGTSIVTQGYGHTPYSSIYPNDWHDGVDIAAEYGTPIYSPNAGTIVAVGNQDNYCYHEAFGKYVAVRDPGHDLILWYAHLGTQNVSVGEAIARGTELGTVGATGLETGTHLHFSIFEASGFSMSSLHVGCGPEPTGQDIDPLNYLGSVYN